MKDQTFSNKRNRSNTEWHNFSKYLTKDDDFNNICVRYYTEENKYFKF